MKKVIAALVLATLLLSACAFSAFAVDDTKSSTVKASVDPSYMATVPATLDFGTGLKSDGKTIEKTFSVSVSNFVASQSENLVATVSPKRAPASGGFPLYLIKDPAATGDNKYDYDVSIPYSVYSKTTDSFTQVVPGGEFMRLTDEVNKTQDGKVSLVKNFDISGDYEGFLVFNFSIQ